MRESHLCFHVGVHHGLSVAEHKVRTLNKLAPGMCQLMMVTDDPISEEGPASVYQGVAEMTMRKVKASDEWPVPMPASPCSRDEELNCSCSEFIPQTP